MKNKKKKRVKCCIHNIFMKNFKWQVITDHYWWAKK